MDISFSKTELAFRDEVRSFIDDHLPPHIRAKGGREPHYEAGEIYEWQRILDKKGWAASHWPAVYGGPGWTAVQRYIFMEELLHFPAPEPISTNINMIGPVIFTFGTQAQKDAFLPKIRNLDYWFCQGFSEPGAGSDLAALRATADRDGDDYVINGQKIWTSNAHVSNWMFGLFRTDKEAKKQQGITFMVLDMKSPGITVRPIYSIDRHHYTNEVFFDNVRVPVGNRIGEENKGWDYAKFLLGNERTGISRVGLSKFRLDRAKAIAALSSGPRGRLADDPFFRRRCLELEIELKALEITALRVIDAQGRSNDGTPDPASSILKLRGAETQQACAELAAEMAGPLAAPVTDAILLDWGPHGIPAGFAAGQGAIPTYFYSRAATVYGGASEVQKSIIAKSILGL